MKVLSDFLMIIFLLLMISYPVMIQWNGGIVRALSIAHPINYLESMHVTGLFFSFIISLDILTKWNKV